MASESAAIAQRSVVDLHQWIQQVFSGHPQSANSLELLLNSFTEDFTMITTGGLRVGLAQVEGLFRRHAGSRPSLEITIEESEVLQHGADGTVIRYRETHHEQGKTSARWSLAIITTQDGHPRWRYLHETAISA